MKIGIIDADLLGRKKHRFPNLVCEKISGFFKEQNATVQLLPDYNWDDSFDEIFISKVFTDTIVPDWIKETDRVHLGGTGFYFDKAPNLPAKIEHHMPDYKLYDDWIASELFRVKTDFERNGKKFSQKSFMSQFKEYTDYCIGFLTRGCFRKCKFCVNQKYDRVFEHSPLSEFYYDECKKICLLDDNFLGYSGWKQKLKELNDTGKPFKFKQGLDERLLTDEKCDLLFSSNYDGDFTFAFDNISDYDIIHEKLKLIRKYASNISKVKFYVLTGFEGTGSQDIENAFRRIELLMRYGCLPYLMRFQNEKESPWKKSKYNGLYISMARWANQPSIFKKMSFRQFCEANQELIKSDALSAPMKALTIFEKDNPEIAKRYFDLRYEEQRL